jgi:hypothetical protein
VLRADYVAIECDEHGKRHEVHVDLELDVCNVWGSGPLGGAAWLSLDEARAAADALLAAVKEAEQAQAEQVANGGIVIHGPSV